MFDWTCTQKGASGGRGLQGLQTIQAVCTDGQRHKDRPRNSNAEATRLHNDSLQRACTRAARLERKPGQSPDATQGKGHDVQALSRCKYLDLSFRLSPFQPCASQEKRSFKSSHQRNRSYSHFTALHQLNEVSKKDVSVPLAETLSVIGHLRQRRPETKKASYQSATETAGELMMKSEWK